MTSPLDLPDGVPAMAWGDPARRVEDRFVGTERASEVRGGIQYDAPPPI